MLIPSSPHWPDDGPENGPYRDHQDGTAYDWIEWEYTDGQSFTGEEADLLRWIIGRGWGFVAPPLSHSYPSGTPWEPKTASLGGKDSVDVLSQGQEADRGD